MRRAVFLFILILGLSGGIVFSQGEYDIPNKILKLREETEKGISYFITKDFSNSIVVLSNSVAMADEIIILISNELGRETRESRNLFVEGREEGSRSPIVTLVRRCAVEAIKFYVVGDVERSIENLNRIKGISLFVIGECYKALSEIEYRKELEKRLSSSRRIEVFEREIVEKVKTEKGVKVMTNFVTNFVTNIINKGLTEREEESIKVILGATILGLFTFIGVIFWRRYRMRKRIKDISELM